MARQSDPQIQKPQMFSRRGRNMSQEEYLQQLEELMKLNRGGFSTFADDTGVDTGFIVPGGVPIAQGQPIGSPPQMTQVDRPTYTNIPPQTPYSPQMGADVPQTPESRVAADDFFQQLGQSLYMPQMPGGQNFSSYEQNYSSEPLQPIATMADGNILWSDGYVRQALPEFMLSGTNALSQGLFGRNQTITQAYGNYNPIEPTPGNINVGTDFRTRDLNDRRIINYFNQPFEVVESYNQAQPGTGYVGNRENRGYGNSVLLRMADGQMIRISHMDENPWQVGDIVNPGETIGIAGATGNVTGEHADVEVYNAQGEIIDPREFQASIANSSQQTEPLYQADMGVPENVQDQPEQPKPSIIQQLSEARQSGGNLVDAVVNMQSEIAQAPQKIQQAVQPESATRKNIAEVLGASTQRAGLDRDFGATEAIQSGLGAGREKRVERLSQEPSQYRPLAHLLGNVAEKVGDVLGIEEGLFSETIAGSPTKQTKPGTLTEINKMDEGQQPGILQDIKNLFTGRGRTANASQGQEINQSLSTPSEFQPGSGIDRLKSDSRPGGSGVNLFSRRKPEDMSKDRVVGQSAGGNLLASPTVAQASAQFSKDTSDPFFSTDLFQRLRGFTNPSETEPIRDQALSTDLFSEDFYSDPGRVSSVFSDTYMADPALRKATEKVKQAYREAYSGEEYDQADVERILSQLPEVLNYSPNLQEPKRAERRGPLSYNEWKQGVTDGNTSYARYLGETGQGSTLDQLRASGEDVESYGKDRDNQRAGGVSSGSKQNFTPAYANYSTAQGNAAYARPPARSPQQNYTPANANYSTSQGTAAYSPAPTPKREDGLFNRAKSFAGGLFKRFFN